MSADCICPTHHQLDKDGYPRMKYNQRLYRGNRLIWNLCFGKIPDDQVVAHKCNNPGCINPSHLYLCSTKENSLHASIDGLYLSGENHPKNRYKDKDILMMMQMYDDGVTQKMIGEVFGITQSAVSQCISRAREYGDNR